MVVSVLHIHRAQLKDFSKGAGSPRATSHGITVSLIRRGELETPCLKYLTFLDLALEFRERIYEEYFLIHGKERLALLDQSPMGGSQQDEMHEYEFITMFAPAVH
jgi:hypothetical protein